MIDAEPPAAAPRDATERILRAASSGSGSGPLAWVAAPLRDARRVLDLGCGAGPLAGELEQRWLGVDVEHGPHRPRLRATSTALPLRTNGVDGVVMLLTLPHLDAVDAVFAEIRRVLRPAGTLVVLVPSASARTWTELRYARLFAPVRGGGPWTNRSALDGAGWLLQAADFAVLGDDRVPFTLPLPEGAAAGELVGDLARSGLWPPGVPADVLSTVQRGLVARARPGAVVPLPLRRLVARR